MLISQADDAGMISQADHLSADHAVNHEASICQGLMVARLMVNVENYYYYYNSFI
jgi:hypothetical protein